MNKLLRDAVQEKKLQVEHIQLLMDTPNFVAAHNNLQRQQRVTHQQQQQHQQNVEQLQMQLSTDTFDLGIEDPAPDPVDEELLQWLKKHSIKQEAIHKIVFHEYTLDDLLRQVTREELVATGMRHGTVCRIWNAILNHRHGGEPNEVFR